MGCVDIRHSLILLSLSLLVLHLTGNSEFCAFLNKRVHPLGGLRVWNEYDAIPYIGLCLPDSALLCFALLCRILCCEWLRCHFIFVLLCLTACSLRCFTMHSYLLHPTLALLVGYQHAGVPIKTRLKRSAKELFQNSSIDAIAVALDVVSPHILYQIGSLPDEVK